MTDTTENRGYNVPKQGEENWHEPINENWRALDEDVQQLYELVSRIDGGPTEPATEAVVGASPGGGYHANAYSDGGYGVAFQAADLDLDSVVVDSDLSAVSTSDLTIELRQFEGGADDPTIVDSTTVSLSGGAERVPLDFTVPPSGADAADANDRYVLQRGSANGDEIPLRRRFDREGDWSTAAYDEETYTDPEIDFLQGTINAPAASGTEPVESWYYFFDWVVVTR